MLLTVAGLPEYLRAASRLLANADRRAIVEHLAERNALAGLVDALVQIWLER